jgi:hypothetical protein
MKSEPGAVDNRLSLNPDMFPEIKDWEDGKSYDITVGSTKTTMTQISPGEFEVEPPVEEGTSNGDEEVTTAESLPKPSASPVADFARETYK